MQQLKASVLEDANSGHADHAARSVLRKHMSSHPRCRVTAGFPIRSRHHAPRDTRSRGDAKTNASDSSGRVSHRCLTISRLARAAGKVAAVLTGSWRRNASSTDANARSLVLRAIRNLFLMRWL